MKLSEQDKKEVENLEWWKDGVLLDKKMTEIEDIQSEVSRIFYHKNLFYKYLHFKKAIKLHEKAKRLLRELCNPNIL